MKVPTRAFTTQSTEDFTNLSTIDLTNESTTKDPIKEFMSNFTDDLIDVSTIDLTKDSTTEVPTTITLSTTTTTRSTTSRSLPEIIRSGGRGRGTTITTESTSTPTTIATATDPVMNVLLSSNPTMNVFLSTDSSEESGQDSTENNSEETNFQLELKSLKERLRRLKGSAFVMKKMGRKKGKPFPISRLFRGSNLVIFMIISSFNSLDSFSKSAFGGTVEAALVVASIFVAFVMGFPFFLPIFFITKADPFSLLNLSFRDFNSS